MANQTDEIMFDQRVVSRHIRRGLVSADDHQAYLESLEDCAELASECETVFSYQVESDEEGDEEAAPAS